MNFQPKTEKECAPPLLPAGVYAFEIITAVDKISKNNNEMIELKVRLFSPEDGEACRVIFDYLMASLAYKLRHCAYAVGVGPKYESGTLTAEDFNMCSGKCLVGIQKDKEGQYPDKNIIKDYLTKEAGAIEAPADGLPWDK